MPELFSQLLEWRRQEQESRSLTKLPSDFYVKTAAYLEGLREEYEREIRANPSGRKGEVAHRTYERALRAARQIVEARTEKVVEAARQASVGAPQDLLSATPEEAELFDRTLTLLREHRERYARFLDPAAPPSSAPSLSRLVERPAPDPPSLAAPHRDGTVFVRVLRDLGPVALREESLTLRSEDLLTLSAEDAETLVRSRSAEIRGSPGG